MNMSRRIWILSVALAVSFSVCAQSKLSPYLRVSLERQLADSLVQTYSSRKAAARPQYVRAFITLCGACDTGSLEQLGVNIRTEAGRMLTADIPVDCLGKVAALEMVEYVEMGAPVKGRMDEAKEQAFVGKVHQGTGLPQAFDGKNVVMGFVDDGFDYAHPNFRTADKSELRIRKVWDQNAAGTPPEGYDYGNELDTEEEMLAVRHDVAESVHGTHVMGIASGAYDTGEPDFAGNAPGAEMVLVSVSTDGMDEADNTTVMDGIHYIFDYAESVGKPCVVNLSLGSHLGPRDGTSSFDQMADELQGPGRLIVGAVGNDGGTACHVSKSFSGAAKDTLQTLYDYQYSYPRHITMEIWGDEGMSLSFIPIVVDKATGDVAAYFELHIEQGPKLEQSSQAKVGLVTGIRGNVFHRAIRCLGETAHSGAIDFEFRHDAVAAVAQLFAVMRAHWIERLKAGDDLVYTNGVVNTPPSQSFNIISGEVTFSLDIRTLSVQAREYFYELFKKEARKIEADFGVRFEFDQAFYIEPALSDGHLINKLESSAAQENIPVIRMPSGAGHDAGDIAQEGIPMAMIFIANQNGSHNHREAMRMKDFLSGVQILTRTLKDL